MHPNQSGTRSYYKLVARHTCTHDRYSSTCPVLASSEATTTPLRLVITGDGIRKEPEVSTSLLRGQKTDSHWAHWQLSLSPDRFTPTHGPATPRPTPAYYCARVVGELGLLPVCRNLSSPERHGQSPAVIVVIYSSLFHRQKMHFSRHCCLRFRLSTINKSTPSSLCCLCPLCLCVCVGVCGWLPCPNADRLK